MRNFEAQRAASQDCGFSRGKAGFPLELPNLLGEAAQPIAGPSPVDHLVRGMHQVVIDRLPLCKKNTEACVLDEERHVAMKVRREAPK